jgi:protein-S-isoprenylcysteine O-methyltransferase Ste14
MTDGTPNDRPNVIHWPPILYVMTLLGAFLLQKMLPIVSPVIMPLPGWTLVFAGVAIGVVALLGFHRAGTSFDPTASADALATGGIYHFTRNPMYLGAVVAFVGLGLAIGWIWLIILSVPMALALVKLAVEREEAYLERRFGQDFLAYKARVRRWL